MPQSGSSFLLRVRAVVRLAKGFRSEPRNDIEDVPIFGASWLCAAKAAR